MTTSKFFTTTGFALALVAGALTGAQAQQTPAPSPAMPSDPSPVNPAVAPAEPDAQMATPFTPPSPPAASAQTVDTTTAIGIAPDGAMAVAQSISNSPIPDTAANRAKYGQPLSHSGQQTDPAGN